MIFIKILKRFFVCLCLSFVILLISTTSLYAQEVNVYVIPGGDSIGLQLNTGIIVTGKYDVKTKDGDLSPWDKSDIEVGDKILEVNNQVVNKIGDLLKIISKSSNNQDVLMKLKRENQLIMTSCKVIKAENDKMSLGLYVKDEVLGVGTMTFIKSTQKTYAALGHSVIPDELNGKSIGNITTSSIRGIRKSLPGIPGEKQATISNESIGSIEKNTQIGIFGSVKNLNDFSSAEKMKIASPKEVVLGDAEIWTVIDGSKKEKYAVKVVELKDQNTTGIKGIKIKITDARLLENTGGIIQGMSGSPIIQNNKLIGAVSHVVVDSPEYGYGVYAMWMYNAF